MNNFYDNHYTQHCLKVNLPENGVGILSIGGQIQEKSKGFSYTQSVELLDLKTQVWTVMESFDERFVFNYYSLVKLNGKPSIIGGFNGTGI